MIWCLPCTNEHGIKLRSNTGVRLKTLRGYNAGKKLSSLPCAVFDSGTLDGAAVWMTRESPSKNIFRVPIFPAPF